MNLVTNIGTSYMFHASIVSRFSLGSNDVGGRIEIAFSELLDAGYPAWAEDKDLLRSSNPRQYSVLQLFAVLRHELF